MKERTGKIVEEYQKLVLTKGLKEDEK